MRISSAEKKSRSFSRAIPNDPLAPPLPTGRQALPRGERERVRGSFKLEGIIQDNKSFILSRSKGVIPAKAGIQKNTGFRVKPGMTSPFKPEA
jgi:hypothetical protein